MIIYLVIGLIIAPILLIIASKKSLSVIETTNAISVIVFTATTLLAWPWVVGCVAMQARNKKRATL